MSDLKKSFVLRINEKMYKELAKWSEEEFRSINGQIEYVLTKALQAKYGKKGDDKEKENTNPSL